MMGLVAQETTGRLNDSYQLVAAISYSDCHVARVSQAIIRRQHVARIDTVVRHQCDAVRVAVTHCDDTGVADHAQPVWPTWRSR